MKETTAKERPARRHSGADTPESTSARAPPRSAPGGQGTDDDDDTKLFSSNLEKKGELLVVVGEFKGKSIKLGAGTVVIGRSSECDLALRAATGVSRRHCKVQYLAQEFVLTDLESRNGTIVNGKAVATHILASGDRLEVGDEVLQFSVEAVAPGEVTPAPPHKSQSEDSTAKFRPAPPTGPFAGSNQSPSPLPVEKKQNVGLIVGVVFGVGVLATTAFLASHMGREPTPSDTPSPTSASLVSVVEPAPIAEPVALPPIAPLVPATTSTPLVSAVAGRVQKVLVASGDTLNADTVVVVVEADNPNLRRKLDSLHKEEREFAAVVDTVPSARTDLDSVRGEIAAIEARLRPQAQKAAKAALVVEVQVKVGDVVSAGTPLLQTSPAR